MKGIGIDVASVAERLLLTALETLSAYSYFKKQLELEKARQIACCRVMALVCTFRIQDLRVFQKCSIGLRSGE